MTRTQQSGFSLLELSVVLGIIALIVGFGTPIGVTALKNSEQMATRDRLTAVRAALDAYARAHGHLPCPANRSLVASDANFALEARNSSTRTLCDTSGTGLVRAPSSGSPFIYIGGVPTRTLGLPDAYAGDAWGNKLTYAVSASHMGDMASYSSTDGPITIETGDRTGTHYVISTARNSTSGGYNAAGASAVYVVLSHGKDAKGAFPMNGTSIAIACGGSTNNDVENCEETNMTFYDSPFSDGTQASTFFDDFIIWGSNALERTPKTDAGPGSSCSGACELWCVPCANAPLFTPSVLCSRQITSTSPCQALCVYAYPTAYQFCP